MNTIAVLRYALNPGEAAPEITAGWDGIEKELNVQTVAGLLTERINGLGMPEENRRRITSVYGKNMRTFHRILQEQNELAQALCMDLSNRAYN